MTEWIVVVPLIEEPEVTRDALERHDVRAGQLLYIDNTPDGAYRDFADRAIVRNGSGFNWGVSRSWNEGLDMGRDWTLILSSSVVLPQGLSAALRILEGPIDEGEQWAVFTEEAFHAFAVSRACVNKIGRFDEQFFSYAEDSDWHYRMRIAGLADRPKVDLGANSLVPSRVARALKRGLVDVDFGELHAAFSKKWGGPPGQERFFTPYNR